MPELKELPVAGKNIKRGVQISTVIHILFLCVLIVLGIYSQQRVEELTKLKEEQVKQEKKEKIEEAVAEEQLEEDIKEILEEINPEASAEEIEELAEALQEEIDTEALEEALIASMDLESPEQQEDQEAYLDALMDELSEHLETAAEETQDDQLEQELLEELVYEDLPEIDNNIENALKRDSLEDLIKDTLKDKINELADEAKKQAKLEHDEQQHNDKNKAQEYKDDLAAVDKQVQRSEEKNASEEDILDAAQKLSELSDKQVDQLKEKNPYDQESVKKEIERNKTALEEKEAALAQAQTEEKKAREEFNDAGQKALDKIKKSLEQHKKEEGSTDKDKKLESLSRDAQKMLNDTRTADAKTADTKKVDTGKAISKINELNSVTNWALSKKADKRQQNASAVKKASKAQAEHRAAKQKLEHAQRDVANAANKAHEKSMRTARNLAYKFKRNTDIKKSVAELNKAIAQHSKPKGKDYTERTKNSKKAMAQLDDARKQFSHDVDKLRKKSLAKTEKSIQELRQLTSDIAALNSLKELNQESAVKALKDHAIQERIEEKADFLRENLQNGTDTEKDQRKEDFKLEAKDTVSTAQSDALAMSESDESSEEESPENEIELLGSALSESLKSALAKKMSLSSAGEGPDGEVGKEKKGKGKSIAGSKKGIEIEDMKGLMKFKNKWKYRKLSIEEKKEILLQNKVAVAPDAPPVLRFARPTLDAQKTNDQAGSADLYVGQLDKREVAALDPKRARKSHPKFKSTNFSAVPYCKKLPTLDGDASDWNLEHCRLSKGKDVFMQWRPDGLYIFAQIRDKSGKFEKSSLKNMHTSFWDYDCMEIWFDMKNTKAKKTDQHACQQFWACAKLPGIGRDTELWEVMWGKSGYGQEKRNGRGKNYVGSRVHADNKGYDIEYFIPRALLTNLNYFRAGQVLGFLYVVNSSHNPHQIQSSIANYNPNYHYSRQPTSWGNF
ncbi:MAG: hypothetical protein HRU15_08125, partial [Planctomycetes bacterium]|nr:hypothetical protein [Planctomycetota bacterium]